MQTKKITILMSLLILQLTSFGQVPTNDECSNAVVLTVGTNSCTSSISGTTQNATQSANTPLPSCFQDGINDDVWFSFTATTSGVLNLNISNAIPSSPLVAMIYTGSCGNLQNYFCSYGDPNNNQFIITQGTTFYIRIYSLSPNPIFYNNFTICAFMTNNDECSNAETLTVGAGERLGTTQSTTQSNTTPLPSCGGAGYNDDVWYKFTATTTGNIYVQTTYNSGTNSDITVQAYSGSCSALTLLNCNTSLNNADNYIVINANLGANYYIRVFSPSTDPLVYNNFYISAYTVYPPANNECSNATSLTPELNLCSGGYGTWETKAATQSSNTPLPSCNSTGIDDDVWFTIHSDSTGIMRVGFQKYSWGNSNGIVLQTYSGSCGSLTLISCNQFTNDGFFDINVIAGTDYFIRAFSPENNVANFSVFGICPYYLSPIPVNDDCANALAVPVNSGTSCTSVVNGSTYSATQSLVGCAGTADDDVWYKFTATATSQKITVTPVVASNGIYDATFQVYSGTCSSLNSLSCIDNTINQDPEDVTLTGLTIGSIYYIRVYSYYDQVGQGDFGICITTPAASAPANNECTSATTLTIITNNSCTSSTIGNTILATESLTGCIGNADDDVWYSFVATTTSHKITVTPSATNGLSNAVFEVFSGTCASLNSLSCVNNTTGTTAEEETINGSIIGNTYYVRVYSFGNNTGQGEFTICVTTPPPPPPANNDCAGAIPLNVSPHPTVCTTPLSGTTLSATQTLPSCNSTFADDDVWYTFVAQSNQTLITVTPAATNGINEVVMQVFNGTCVLTGGVCYNDPGSASFPLSTTFFTTAGFTYTVRLYSAANGTGQGDFAICASAYNPPNDLCSGSINVPINSNNSCTLTTTGTTVHSTFEGPSTCLATNTAGWDVWYKFTATSTEHTFTVTPTATDGINNVVVSFFASNGVTCATITGTGQCYNATTGAAAETFIEENLVVGGTYYFRVFSAATGVANQGAFTVCINTNPIPANDDCSGAITVPVNNDATCTNTLQGTTVGSTSSSIAMCGNGAPKDVWYKFVATATAYNIAVTPTATGGITVPSWELLSGTCSNLISKGCTSSPTTYEDLIIGNTYYLRITAQDNLTQYQGAFIICVKTISLPNDICTGAVNVPINNSLTCVSNVTGTTVGASISQSTGKKDVWYKFTATAIAHTIRVAPTADVIKNVAFEVYSGSCGTLTSIAYTDNNPNGNNADTAAAELQSVENLTIGNTYYVRVFSGAYIGSNPTGSFTICVSLADNDVCSAAATLTVNATTNCASITTGTTLNASQSLSGCTGDADDDVWFKFVATSVTHKIIINATTSNGIQSPVIELFSGTCGSLNSLQCNTPANFTNNTFTKGGLTVGATYYIRVYSYGFLNAHKGNFTICINTPNVPNDSCNGAIALTVNSNNTCTSSTTGTTIDATQSILGCTGNADDDVWYKFVATNLTHKIVVNATATNAVKYPMVELFSGACGTLNSLYCSSSSQSNSSNNSFVKTGLTVGTTYYVRVYSYENGTIGEGNFTICINTTNVPANDSCNGAIALTINNDNVCNIITTGTSVDASQSMPGCIGNADDDVWYKFVATAVTHKIAVYATNTNGILNPNTELFSGTCGSLTSIHCSNQNKFVKNGLTIGATYYLRVYSNSNDATSQGNFTICITKPVVLNDNCSGAVPLPVNSTNLCTITTLGTTEDASQSMPGCTGTADDDVWFKFVATSVAHKITVNGTANITSIQYPIIQLFSGTCSNLTSLYCHNSTYYGNTFIKTGLTLGATYYVRVYSESDFTTKAGEFTICINTPNIPENDNCNAAISLTVNSSNLCTNSTTGTTVDATQSMPSCTGVADDDVWYKFVATSVTHKITVTTAATNGIKFPNIEIFNGTCAALNSIGCILSGNDSINTFTISSLTIGNTYYVRVFSDLYNILSDINNGEGLFNICVSTTTLPPCNNTELYGLTPVAGAYNGYNGFNKGGTVFHYTPTTSAFTLDYTFNLGYFSNNIWYYGFFNNYYGYYSSIYGYNNLGSQPSGSLVQKDNKLYGMTSWGGSGADSFYVSGVDSFLTGGVIFEWDPTTNIYTKKISFNGLNGAYPLGSLTLNANKFYGMTAVGGVNGTGVIFEWDPTSNVYTKKVDLSLATGGYPQGSLTYNGGKFYGMTPYGGANANGNYLNSGVIFEWDPVTNIYTKKIDLDTTNGYFPTGSLSFNAGKFYGMTSRGGVNDVGVIFEWNPASNIYIKKIDLNLTIGAVPTGSLTFNAGKFYGMTYRGGANDVGVIFEWDPATNIYTKKIDFNGTNGAHPQGSLTYKDGKFYATTTGGGANNLGVIFEWNPITNIYTKLVDLNLTTGAYQGIENNLTVYNCNAVVSYIFNGNGNWSNAANWQGGNKPPLILLNGSEIIIDPIINGECVLDIPPAQIQEIKQGAKITVMAGKKLRLQNGLIIQ
jgi:uncharacterized repeat protein (TIGR03803 family)